MSSRYDAVYKRSIEDPEGFWAEAAEAVHWYEKWDNRSKPVSKGLSRRSCRVMRQLPKSAPAAPRSGKIQSFPLAPAIATPHDGARRGIGASHRFVIPAKFVLQRDRPVVAKLAAASGRDA